MDVPGQRPTVVVALLIVTLVAVLSSCATTQRTTHQSRYERTITGAVKPAGMTSFMYGSHLLYDDRGRMTYALTSDQVELSHYEGEWVEVSGDTVDGYPVDGGPPYLRVEQIRRLEK